MKSQNLEEVIGSVLALAKQAGATSAEADIGSTTGLTVSARMGEVETVEHQRDKGMSITVYINHKKGSASTTDFGSTALKETVTAACTIARNASEDEYAGLLDPQYLARDIPELDLYHPWDLSPEAAIRLAIECENGARNADKRISNSEGASVSTSSGSRYYGNSHGFCGGWDWSAHSIDCSLIAEQDGKMQREGWYTRKRDYQDLDDINFISTMAASRTVSRLGARKLSTRSVPVIFEAPLASSLFSALIAAISGSSQYRKSSFLLGKAGEQIFPDHINLYERPHIQKSIGSAPFDNDGMATRERTLISAGVLQGYLLSAYSARKLKLDPTGNAGGVHNLIVEPGVQDLQGLLHTMGKGLLITEMIGFGVNQVTGDYSRGAAGFWVENGEIQFPVEEITVAGNLINMYKQIMAVGSDVDTRNNIQTGSVLIENMTVAGE